MCARGISALFFTKSEKWQKARRQITDAAGYRDCASYQEALVSVAGPSAVVKLIVVPS